jgi:MYXO-CTERM domain-containing protein
MNARRFALLCVVMVVVAMLAVTPLQAAIVAVDVTGQVAFSGIGDPPLSAVSAGDSVQLSFTVDSTNFVDGVPGDTRSYVIDEPSFSLTFDTPLAVGLLNPFPAGQTPYFTLVDGFPVSDGFFVSTSPLSPGGVPLEQEPYNLGFDLGYTGDTLASLDILDATGVYDFGGLVRFSFNLWTIFPDNVGMEMEFAQMTISAAEPAIPEPAALGLIGLAMLVVRRRRS